MLLGVHDSLVILVAPAPFTMAIRFLARAMSIAASPTPPPALWINTLSSGFSAPITTSSCQAVR